jgi:hypothetical protein
MPRVSPRDTPLCRLYAGTPTHNQALIGHGVAFKSLDFEPFHGRFDSGQHRGSPRNRDGSGAVVHLRSAGEE